MGREPLYDRTGEAIGQLVQTQLEDHLGETVDETLIAHICEELCAAIGLVGIQEAASIVNVSSQRISSLRKAENANFPRPVVSLRCGPIYLSSEVKDFADIPRPVGRPPKTPKY